MSPIRDPLLVVWEAMNLLSEVGEYYGSPETVKLISSAERALCILTEQLIRDAEVSPFQTPMLH